MIVRHPCRWIVLGLAGVLVGCGGGSSPTPTTPTTPTTTATPLPVINRLATSPWPRYRGDARNTGRGTGLGAVGLAKWQFSVNPPGTVFDTPPTVNSPVTYGISTSASIGPGGTLYVGSHNLYALDRVTGAEKWHVASDDGNGIDFAPAIGADGTVYVGVGKKFCALDGATGRKKWGIANYGGNPPTIGDNGLVYFGRDKLYACDSVTGAKKWEYDPALTNPNQDAAIVSSPTLGADGTVYVITSTLTGGNTICALDGATGAKKDFARGVGFLGGAAPVIGADGTIYLGVRGLLALDGVTGAKKWGFDDVGIMSAPAVGTDGTLYAVASGSTVYAIDGATGAQKWKVTLPRSNAFINAEVTVDAGNTVYVGSQQGTVYAFDGATGGIKWQYAAPNAGAVTTGGTIDSDGTLYAGFADGTLRALR